MPGDSCYAGNFQVFGGAGNTNSNKNWDGQASIPATFRDGTSNTILFAEKYSRCNGNGNAHLDVSNLSFCDVSGIRALVDAANDLGDGRRLLLHGLPEQLQTVIRVTGWSDLPTLVLCACGAAS